jgi:excisionase family DNA binding protein
MLNGENSCKNYEVLNSIPRLLSASEVAKILRISKKTVNKLAREGRLGCVQVTSKERRFTEQQIREYIESRSLTVRIDTRIPDRVKSMLPKGGAKSSRVFDRANLLKEIRSWQ